MNAIQASQLVPGDNVTWIVADEKATVVEVNNRNVFLRFDDGLIGIISINKLEDVRCERLEGTK